LQKAILNFDSFLKINGSGRAYRLKASRAEVQKLVPFMAQKM